MTRRCGGTGRHKGLKIPRSKIRTGSIPVSGTKKCRQPYGCLHFLLPHRDRTHLNASVRWTLAATSSQTGGYNYFSPPLGGEKCRSIPVSGVPRGGRKMQIDPGQRCSPRGEKNADRSRSAAFPEGGEKCRSIPVSGTIIPTLIGYVSFSKGRCFFFDGYCLFL